MKFSGSYTVGDGTITVYAPDTDGTVRVRVSLKPEDMQELIELFYRTYKDVYIYGFLKESQFTPVDNEPQKWWGRVRYWNYRNEKPKSSEKLEKRWYANKPQRRLPPTPPAQEFNQAWEQVIDDDEDYDNIPF